MIRKTAIFIILFITNSVISKAQFFYGPNIGYATGAYYNVPYAGAGCEVLFYKMRYGINIDVLKPRKLEENYTLYSKTGNNTLTNIATLKYTTFSPEFFIKKYPGRHKSDVNLGFYFGFGMSYKFLFYNRSVGKYDSTLYNSEYDNKKSNLKQPFIDLMIGSSFKLGPGFISPELKLCLPANEENGAYIFVNLPAMFKLGLIYRFGKSKYDKWN